MTSDGSVIMLQHHVLIWNGPGWSAASYDPDGKRMLDIRMPVPRPASRAFGGPDLRRLYITSARTGLSGRMLAEHPACGDLFMVQTDSKGQVEYQFAG